MFINKPESKRP